MQYNGYIDKNNRIINDITKDDVDDKDNANNGNDYKDDEDDNMPTII